jgi:AcrR family transcriptional regulator
LGNFNLPAGNRQKMNWEVQIQMNERLFLRDPAQSELGRNIVKKGLEMIEKLGLEEFTFKKLAAVLKTNESSIYRYFENKHRLLIYLAAWYWRWMEYQVMIQTTNLKTADEKIEAILKILLLKTDGELAGGMGLDKETLHKVVIKEGSKTYLTNHVSADNKLQLFHPYKDLCGRIASVFLEKNKEYKYARSLATTLMEMAHFQYYFMNHLPSLTDFGLQKDDQELHSFLKSLVHNSLKK